ncbi:MAG: circularly permuted type 2 ATP-grasp protein, partial [Limisphaerales bacterium]
MTDAPRFTAVSPDPARPVALPGADLPPGASTAEWQALAAEIGQLGREEFALRAENARRILREHGVTCGTAGDARAPEQPWELDCVPLVLGAEEWQALEAGVIQRAHLLNRLLRDLYGTQRLLRDGFVPAPLVHANPAYLRACQAVPPPGGNYLLTYAVDLARGADGQWWVIADRTQAPTGMGFALENRTVVSRVLPELVQALQPRPLSTVLRARRDSLLRLAPRHPDNPAVVLLTPGPRSEAYFEHAYLARLMGFTLVEGGDLTVRDRAVFIKTLDGLQPADVILRRVTDAFCDPLELRADSLLGVPGLVEATRAGNVAVANALGSGLLESPAFLPFLPGLCRHLLDEELRLPAIATWWCGQGQELQHVLAHAETLALRSAFLLGDAPVRPAQ